jgi:hypothetical protein
MIAGRLWLLLLRPAVLVPLLLWRQSSSGRGWAAGPGLQQKGRARQRRWGAGRGRGAKGSPSSCCSCGAAAQPQRARGRRRHRPQHHKARRRRLPAWALLHPASPRRRQLLQRRPSSGAVCAAAAPPARPAARALPDGRQQQAVGAAALRQLGPGGLQGSGLASQLLPKPLHLAARGGGGVRGGAQVCGGCLQQLPRRRAPGGRQAAEVVEHQAGQHAARLRSSGAASSGRGGGGQRGGDCACKGGILWQRRWRNRGWPVGPWRREWWVLLALALAPPQHAARWQLGLGGGGVVVGQVG